MTDHRRKQIDVINKIEDQVRNNFLTFSTVTAVNDYEDDSRMTLTAVHLPHKNLLSQIDIKIISPLKTVEPELYYYTDENMHMTIKNIRVINDPPHYTRDDIAKAEMLFSNIIPTHKKFNVYFYRLLLFPNNLSLIGTTDEELDSIVLDLDKKLTYEKIPDDKNYINSKYFFSNMTLARFNNVSDRFKNKVEEISENLRLNPYAVDSVSLLTCNAVLKKRTMINTWNLK